MTLRPLIATPSYGGVVCLNYMTSILRLRTFATQFGLDIDFYFHAGESLVTRARNDCVAYFLEHSTFTHLFWIDSDIGFEPFSVLRLLKSGHDVVAGVYPMKSDNASFTADARDLTEIDDGFAQIIEAPTGFMCIKRSVFERLITECGANLSYRTRDGSERYRFFDTMIDPETSEYLSEDYAFCRRWQEIGGTVHVDLKSSFSHQGTKLYTGAFA